MISVTVPTFDILKTYLTLRSTAQNTTEIGPCRDEGPRRMCPACELSGAGSAQPGLDTDPYSRAKRTKRSSHYDKINTMQSYQKVHTCHSDLLVFYRNTSLRFLIWGMLTLCIPTRDAMSTGTQLLKI